MVSRTRTKLTPPAFAAQWGIDVSKVLTWIRSGELRAIDAATVPGGRPRYLIDVADVALFEQRRQVRAPEPRTRTRRKPVTDVIEFF